MKIPPIKSLKVMLEYKSTGLFVTDPPERIGEINHEILGLSKKTSEELYTWIKKYDQTLDWDDPGNSPPVPTEYINELNREGVRLTDIVQKETGSKIHVYYQPAKN
jgi:hypothetical protein